MGVRAIAATLLGAWLVAFAHPRVDSTRLTRSIDNALLFAPDGDQLSVASLGFNEPIADLLWVRTVLVFGERWDRTADTAWIPWMSRMLLAVTTLDPAWRSPYYYGGLLMRILGDVETSDEMFRRGMRNLPEDPFFPFSLGMNAYLVRGDTRTAGEYLAVASKLPRAPAWYGAAAAAMMQRHGERRAAIEFLREILRTTETPLVVQDTERKLQRLYHDEIVERWEQACLDHRAKTGQALASPEALADLGFTLPANPRGDAWIVGTDGVVRSEGAERDRLRRMRIEEWALAGP